LIFQFDAASARGSGRLLGTRVPDARAFSQPDRRGAALAGLAASLRCAIRLTKASTMNQ